MDLLLSTLLFQILVFVLYLPYARLYWPLFAVLLYSVLWYWVDDSEKTGNRSWTWLRNWRIWQTQFTAVEYLFGNKNLRSELEKNERVVFVILRGNMTNMGMVSGFGFHGGVFAKMDIVYLLPSMFFRVPGIREILLWSGAISYDAGLQKLNDTLLGALNRQKSVCFALNGMDEIMGKRETESEISEELFEFAKEQKIQFVPVEVTGERDRYAIYESSMQILGYPCPFLFGPRIFGAEPPPKLELIFGNLTNPAKFTDVQHFNKWFFTGNEPSTESLV